MKHLKLIRTVIGFSVGLLFFLVFFNPYGIFSRIGILIEGTQFTPTLINTVFNHSIRSIIALVLLILLTLALGRVYCSFLCPLGILQDLAMLLAGKGRFKQRKNRRNLRYIITALVFLSVISGSLALVHLLDPYSVFGRAVTHIAGRGFTWFQNQVSGITTSFHLYFLDIAPLPLVSGAVIILALMHIAVVIVMAIKGGRIYCNTICPVGTILGLISRISPLPLSINDHCTQCGACESVCRAGCISFKDRKIDNELCVRCYDCTAVCPEGAVSHGLKIKEVTTNLQKNEDSSKRDFLSTSLRLLPGLLVVLGVPGRLFLNYFKNKNQRDTITPPGSLSREHFFSSCISCHLCVSVCPTHILTPSTTLSSHGILQPVVNYAAGFCQFNCNNCTTVCPTNAIQELAIEQKQKTAIGKVEYHRRHCIVETNKTDCGACAEHCPTGAVKTTEKGGLFYPEIFPTFCIGCGACEHVCPVEPKAIRVTPLDVHTTVSVEDDSSFEDIRIEEEEFPF